MTADAIDPDPLADDELGQHNMETNHERKNTMTQTTDTSDELAHALTNQCLVALQKRIAPDDVALGAMMAALNVALELLPAVEVADWLRRLADTVEEHDDAAPGRAN